MSCLKTVFICAVLVAAAAERRFPEGFKFGAATSSYQIEGGWNASDKGESIWDHFIHTRPEVVQDLTNADVACDSYHLWREDVQMLADLNVDHYRFSISWPRLLPTGFPNYVSEDGSRYYGDLIDGLLEKGIEPVVTLFHWDLPQPLQELGGWANPLIADWFADYARVVYDLYGDRVKTWLTINEPIIVCDFGYNGYIAPAVDSEGRGSYLCNKNLLLAHAKAYRLYEKEYKAKYQGQISLANSLFWMEPETEDDVELTQLVLDHTTGRYTHPIYSSAGGWPPALEAYIEQKSIEEGEPRSRLPAFTQEELELVRGSFDFCGLNHYTTLRIRGARPGEEVGQFMMYGIRELGAVTTWLSAYPPGFRAMLSYVKQQYGDVPIMITENGFSDTEGDLDDQPRIDFFKSYLTQMHLAMEEDGVNVVGYTAWSLMDNFEWVQGYESSFGLYHVDFSSPGRERTPRRSARYYAQLARTKDIDASYQYDVTAQ